MPKNSASVVVDKIKSSNKLKSDKINDSNGKHNARREFHGNMKKRRANYTEEDGHENKHDDLDSEEDIIPEKLSAKIIRDAKIQRLEMENEQLYQEEDFEIEDDAQFESENDDENDDDIEGVEFDGDYVTGTGLSEEEEAIVQNFLQASRNETKTLADIIMEKIREKEEVTAEESSFDSNMMNNTKNIPPKVVEVYTAVGKLLHHYKSGKLPKALKMLPHLKNWEEVLWLTRPDEWSPSATYACTRIFASNLNAKMAQRFYNLVLLEKCRDDIQSNKKLNYHLYLALKKALFKPAPFYKGILLPLAQSQSCTLREATIIGSVLAKVSIQANHSAAAILRLAEMEYSGSTSFFIRVLLNKKYSLPKRVIDALVDHFYRFLNETRNLPILWHQALLTFTQRYKFELNDEQRERIKALLRKQQHHLITAEIRRELFATKV